MTDLYTQQSCEKLAAENPREFLYQVYRDSPYANLDLCVATDDNLKKVSRRWAIDPAHDGLKTAFNFFAKGQQRAIYRQLVDYRQRTMQQFDTADNTYIKPQNITPSAFIRNIEDIVPLTRMLIARGIFDTKTAARMQRDCDICENALLPLLRAMPQHKSLADYPKPEKAKAALRQL